MIHTWLEARPIARDLIFGAFFLIITPLITPIVTMLWKFCTIPPQRLNKWILKARIENLIYKQMIIQRLRSDMRFFVFTCIRCVFELLTGIWGMIIAIAATVLRLYLGHGPLSNLFPAFDRSHARMIQYNILFNVMFFISYFLFIAASRRFIMLYQTTGLGKTRDSKLQQKIDSLISKLPTNER